MDVGIEQVRNASANGWRDLNDERSTLRAHQVGNCGEAAFAQWRELPWSPSFIPQGKGPDVAHYEVKTAAHPQAAYLIVPARQLLLRRVYVAVHQVSALDYDLHGWCRGYHVQTYPPVKRYGWEPSHWVPFTHLAAMDTLP